MVGTVWIEKHYAAHEQAKMQSKVSVVTGLSVLLKSVKKMDRRYFLQRIGIKPTSIRIEVLRVLQEIAPLRSDWTMSALMQIMFQKDLAISQASLTNVLNVFSNKHLVSRYVDKEGIVKYQISNIASLL